MREGEYDGVGNVAYGGKTIIGWLTTVTRGEMRDDGKLGKGEGKEMV